MSMMKFGKFKLYSAGHRRKGGSTRIWRTYRSKSNPNKRIVDWGWRRS